MGHAVPLRVDQRAGVSPGVAAEIDRRIGLVVDRVLREQGPHYLWSNAGCHIMMGEVPFYEGFLGESLTDFRRNAYARLEAREDGLWVWRPREEKHECLGVPGAHTLGQASHTSMMCLRAARLTGDPELGRAALEAAKQMEQYEVPRGAQMWECPPLSTGHSRRGPSDSGVLRSLSVNGGPGAPRSRPVLGLVGPAVHLLLGHGRLPDHAVTT